MSENKHHPEPWRAWQPERSNGFWYIDGYDTNSMIVAYRYDAEANARRIALCVNACKNLTNGELDDLISLGGMSLDMLKRLTAQRDELVTRLTALEDIATAVEADIDCGRPLEYNVEELRVELTRARASIEEIRGPKT